MADNIFGIEIPAGETASAETERELSNGKGDGNE